MNEAKLNVFYTVPSQEHLKTFNVVASWLDTQNTWPAFLGSFTLIVVV